MPLVVNGVCRFTINQSMEGNDIANVLDMFIDTTGSSMAREDAIIDQAGVLVENWAGDLLVFQSNQLTFDSVSWVDLDESDGSTGMTTTGGSITLPDPGGSATGALPTNVAGLVRKNLATTGRGFRSGRMFLAGLVESQTTVGNGNLIEPANITTLNAGLASFLGDINQDGTTSTYDSRLVVVHITSRDADGRPLTGDSREVGSLIIDQLLATQRRRLRR